MLVKNFLFHRVSDEADDLWPPMSTSLFRTLIRYISSHYHIVSLEDHVLNDTVVAKRKKAATILFDDGYKDNIQYAVPILNEYKSPASFYVVTDCIDNNTPTWTYIVDHLLQHTQVSELQLEMKFVPDDLRRMTGKTRGERVQFGKRLKPWMKSLSNEQRTQVLAHLQLVFSDVELPRNKMMSWNDLQQMESAGFKIGSHSLSHPLLASITNEGELYRELKDSGDCIQLKLGKFPVSISYPVGSYDERVIASACKAGYQLGLAVKQKFYNSKKDDRFAIPRVELYNEPVWKCHLRINGVYNWVKHTLQG